MKARACCPICQSWVDMKDECGMAVIPWHKGRFNLWCNGTEKRR